LDVKPSNFVRFLDRRPVAGGPDRVWGATKAEIGVFKLIDMAFSQLFPDQQDADGGSTKSVCKSVFRGTLLFLSPEEWEHLPGHCSHVRSRSPKGRTPSTVCN
jgi:hypothetical protein